jgi:hypothetical protein
MSDEDILARLEGAYGKGIVNLKTVQRWIVMLPPGETLDRSFFGDIVLDSWKKKLAQTPDPNPEKGSLLHLDNARPHLANHEIQTNNLTGLSHPADSPYLVTIDFWSFGSLKTMMEGCSFETTEELQGKVTEILISSRH